MTKIKTDEASGAALDWLVAKCEGADVGIISPGWVVKASYSVFSTRRLLCPLEGGGEFYSPSTIWEQGGPLIARHNISCIRMDDRYGTDENGFCNNQRIPVWAAMLGQNPAVEVILEDEFYGATPLEAAMRCYVAAKMGDTIEIPEELLT